MATIAVIIPAMVVFQFLFILTPASATLALKELAFENGGFENLNSASCAVNSAGVVPDPPEGVCVGSEEGQYEQC
jgi:hypothetical protein